MLARRTFAPALRPRIFVCGNTMFAEFVATTLVDLGHDPSSIRIERFGNFGGPS
jgi:ferredoxin-NADP reductase